MDCSDVAASNFQVGSSDSNNFDGDGDGIGRESSSNNNDVNNLNAIFSDNTSRCPDGSHCSPSGDCERVTGNNDNNNDSGEDGSSDNGNSDEVSDEQNDSNSDDSGGNEN